MARRQEAQCVNLGNLSDSVPNSVPLIDKNLGTESIYESVFINKIHSHIAHTCFSMCAIGNIIPFPCSHLNRERNSGNRIRVVIHVAHLSYLHN